ncbi:MAG: hypothetical protein WBD22_12755 [Pyrinomonadaceae bacterium]
MLNSKKKFGRRTIALFWLLIVAIVIGTLIYLEQIPVLYVLATISLVVLLLVVGMSDLEKIGQDGTGQFGSDN